MKVRIGIGLGTQGQRDDSTYGALVDEWYRHPGPRPDEAGHRLQRNGRAVDGARTAVPGTEPGSGEEGR